MINYFRAIFASLFLFSFLACETKDDDNIEIARQCSNNAAQIAATNATLAAQIASQSCEPLIQNVQTTEAGLIGVGLLLIEEQKLSNLTTVESAISQNTNAFSTAVAFLVFSSQTRVNSLLTYATRSQDPGSNELANLISFAYVASAVSGGLNSSSTPTDVYNAVGLLKADPVNGPVAAQAVLSAQAAACGTGSSSNSALCTDLTTAIGGATTTNAVLTNIMTYIQNGG